MVADDPEHPPPDVGQLRLTYAQLSERLRVSGEAARILVRRRGWFRVIPNQKGQPTIVVIPVDELAAEQEKRTQSPDTGATSADIGSGGLAGAVALLDRTLSRLVEAERRADDALRRAEDAEKAAEVAQIAQAEAEADAVGVRVRLDATQAQAKSAEQAERKRAAEVRAAWEAERNRAETAAAELRQAEAAAEKAERDQEAAVAIADAAVRAAEELRQAEAARAGQGRWQRLRAAWRGE